MTEYVIGWILVGMIVDRRRSRVTKDPDTALQWLGNSPGLNELCAEYPDEWERVQGELGTVLAQGRPEALQAYLKRLSMQGPAPEGGRGKSTESAVRNIIRYRMAHSAVKQHCIAIATGIESGKVRFNLLNGFVAQKLLFADGLERKPVSMFWFRMLWPLIWQKRLLMPLVQPEGIYCFYSRQLIAALVEKIGTRPCIEIAAGDGTLTRFLAQQGVQIKASDDYSWEHAVRYPEQVARLDAKEALRLHAPEVVVCSWPPAGNNFERQIFRTRTVQLYIAINSRHRFASGNWGDYQQQSAFSIEEDRALSRLVLPPELDAGVYLFRRKPGSTQSNG
jgi:hypothetical protein